MDCAITSLFPAGGAPPPTGADAPAGSSAELAAMFASLVAGLGPDPADASAEQGPPDAVPDLPVSLPPSSEEGDESPVALGGMPWWLTAQPQQDAPTLPAPDAAVQLVAGAQDVPIEGRPLEIGGAVTPPSDPVSPMIPEAAGEAVQLTDLPELTEATEEAPASNAAPTASTQAAPPQAARALARALALLEGTVQPVQDHAAAPVVTEAAANPDANPVARSTAGAETPPTQAARTVDPAGAPRTSAQAVPPMASAATAVPTPSAETGTSDAGSGGSGASSRHAEPAPVPSSRGVGATDASSDGFLPAQAIHGAEPRAVGTGPAGPREAATVAEHEAAVADQLVQAIRIRAGEGTGVARVRLNPEFLGEVRIELKITGDRVTAVLHVERDDVRQQIESGTPALRAALAAHGLELEEVTVREDDSSRREGSREEPREPRERKRRREPAGPFELPD